MSVILVSGYVFTEQPSHNSFGDLIRAKISLCIQFSTCILLLSLVLC